MRAGSGTPEAGKGYDGDLYIDTATVAFYECASGDWMLFGPPVAPTPEPTDGPDDSGDSN